MSAPPIARPAAGDREPAGEIVAVGCAQRAQEHEPAAPARIAGQHRGDLLVVIHEGERDRSGARQVGHAQHG